MFRDGLRIKLNVFDIIELIYILVKETYDRIEFIE